MVYRGLIAWVTGTSSLAIILATKLRKMSHLIAVLMLQRIEIPVLQRAHRSGITLISRSGEIDNQANQQSGA